MQKLRLPVIALLLGACVVPALSNSASAQTCACAGAGAGISSDAAPPALPDYDQPPIPAPGALWTPGYWAWNNEDYYWVPGTWAEPPQPGLLWTPAYWAFVGGVYVFNRGYWGPHVGFYGGVYYGFGYGGLGYDGGLWNNGVFFYNRTVNNIGSIAIVNVYEKNVTVNYAGARRASFNGPGGAVAKPTAEEEAAANETHLPPTDRQVEHARAASMKSDLFLSTNQGKPAIAATAKPAAFTGPGVVKAKAGAAPVQPAEEKPTIVEPKKEEKKEPAGGELKPETKTTPAVEPKVEEKKAPAGGELKPETKTTPAVEPKVEEKPKAEEKPKVEERPTVEEKPKAEEKRAPAANKQVEQPAPAAHAPVKEKCGKPGEPKCQ